MSYSFDQEAMRACRRTSVMNKLGVEDVEEWLKITDRDGVRFKLKSSF